MSNQHASMRKVLWIAAVLCLGLARADAASGRATMEGDARGQRNVRVHETGDHVAEVLNRLKKETGVSLEAEEPLCDWVIVAAYQGSLQGFMEALASFMGVDRQYRARWVRQGQEGSYRYRLERDVATQQQVEKRRREREAMVLQRMEGLLQIPTMNTDAWTLLTKQDPRLAESLRGAKQYAQGAGGMLASFGKLSPQERRYVYACGKVAKPLGDLAGGQGRRQFMERLAGQDAANWSGHGTMTFFMAGPGPLNRMFCSRISDDPMHPGEAVTNAVGMHEIFPDLTMKRQQEDWRRLYGDPAPSDTQKVVFQKPGESAENIRLRREALMRIAVRAGINLIADDCGQISEPFFFPAQGSVSALLDAACRDRPVLGHREGMNYGAFWRKVEGTYLVRSLSWAEEEERLVPHRWLVRWREKEAKHGKLGLDDIVAMAGLHPDQLVQLGLWYKQAPIIRHGQVALRWYARANAETKRRLRTQPGVPVAALVKEMGDTGLDLDPLMPEPRYMHLLRGGEVPLERLHLLITEGYQKVAGKRVPALGIVFEGYSQQQRSKQPTTLAIPLVRSYPDPELPPSIPTPNRPRPNRP